MQCTQRAARPAVLGHPLVAFLLLLTLAPGVLNAGGLSQIPGTVIDEKAATQSLGTNLMKTDQLNISAQMWRGASPQALQNARMAMQAPIATGVTAQVQQVGATPFVPAIAKIGVDIKIWYKQIERRYDTVYEATFTGDYTLINPSDDDRTAVALTFPLPTAAEMVWNVDMDVKDNVNRVEPKDDEKLPEPQTRTAMDALRWSGVFEPGEEKVFHISYIVRGQQEYAYLLGSAYQMPHFSMEATIHGATEINLPPDILPLSIEPEVDAEAKTIKLKWYYDDVLTTKNIRITLPTRGAEVTFADRLEQHQLLFRALMRVSPVFAALFLVLLWLAMRMHGLALSRASYLLLGINALLLAPMTVFGAALLGTKAAFWIALSVVTLVGVMYSRLAGTRVARAVLLLMLLVVGAIAYGILQPERQGLVLTLSGLVSVAYFMALSAAARPVRAGALGPLDRPGDVPQIAEPPDERVLDGQVPETGPEPGETSEPDGGEATPSASAEAPAIAPEGQSCRRLCTSCGTDLAEGYKFCPGCAAPVSPLTIECPECAAELCAVCGADFTYCPRCGARLRE